MSTPTHDTPPDGSTQIATSPDTPHSAHGCQHTLILVRRARGRQNRRPRWTSDSWPSESSATWTSDSWPSGSSGSSTAEHSLGSPDQLSTDESHPLSSGRIEHPPPAPPSEPGPSTRPHPPQSAELSDEEIAENAARILVAMSRQGFRPRTYGSGFMDAAKGKLPGTIDTMVYVSSSPFPLLLQTIRVMNILTL
jgi:hypothetical protein